MCAKYKPVLATAAALATATATARTSAISSGTEALQETRRRCGARDEKGVSRYKGVVHLGFKVEAWQGYRNPLVKKASENARCTSIMACRKNK